MNFGKDKYREDRKIVCVMPLTLFLSEKIILSNLEVNYCEFMFNSYWSFQEFQEMTICETKLCFYKTKPYYNFSIVIFKLQQRSKRIFQ